MAEADELQSTVDALMAIVGAIATTLKLDPAELIGLVEHSTRNIAEPRRSAVRAKVAALAEHYRAAL